MALPKSLNKHVDGSTRNDLGYLSEVNSCDSGHEVTSMHDDIMPQCIKEQDVQEAFRIELEKIKLALHEKTLECEQLKVDSAKVQAEIEDLTTSLFEEANKMVYEANLKQDKAEKKLAAAEGKIEALEIEVTALKSLVITSTPSNPNPTCHPQLMKKNEGSPIRLKTPKRFFNNTKTEKSELEEFEIHNVDDATSTILKPTNEIDDVFFDQLKCWYDDLKQVSCSKPSSTFCDCFTDDANEYLPLNHCNMITKSEFLHQIFSNHVNPCLTFANQDLSHAVSSYIHKNLLSVEQASSQATGESQFCSLSKTRSPCKHRIRFSDADTWYTISQSSRNKITSVCNFLTYLRYIRQGIVKHTVEQMYWEMIRHRLEISFASLGYYKKQI